MDAAAGRGGGRAEVNVWRGGAVLAPGGAEEELAKIVGAATYVATDEVGVHGFERGGRGDVAGENGRAEAGGEALDLGFEAFEGGVGFGFRSAVGDVAVGPGDVFARRSAGGVEEGGLAEEDERALGVAAGHGGFGGGDVGERASEVDGGGAETCGGVPGDGLGERVVDLEGGGTVLVGGELAAIAGGELILIWGEAGESEELAGGDVAESEVACGEIGESADGRGDDDAAAELVEPCGESVGEGLRAAAWDGPADGVGGSSQDKTEGSAEGLAEGEEGVSSESCEEGAGGFGTEVTAGDSGGGENRVEAEAGEQEWVLGPGDDRAKDVGGEIGPAGDEGFHQCAPGWAVFG